MSPRPALPPREALTSLADLLATAASLLRGLTMNGLVPRLERLAAWLLPEDREPLLEVLEHEVAARLQVESDSVWAGFVLRPNPFARLFTRAVEPRPAQSLVYVECVQATRVGARIALQAHGWGAAEWEPATVDACRRLSARQRALVQDVSSRILAGLVTRLAAADGQP